MKRVLMIFSVLITSSLTWAGPFASGGPTGQEFLNCTGTARPSTEEVQSLRVRVLVQLGVGIVARLYVNGTLDQSNVVKKDTTDPRGLLYTGSPLSVLVPDMQNPNNPAGTYNALLDMDGTVVLMTCGAGAN